MSIGEEIFNIGNNNFCSKLYGLRWISGKVQYAQFYFSQS